MPQHSIAQDGTVSVILIRHGHVQGIAPPSFRGRADMALTDLGVRQAEATRDHLATLVRPSTVYTSPLSRCARTGSIVAAPHGVAVIPCQSFIDRDYGEWQGQTFEQVRSASPEAFNRWLRTPHLAAVPGGECLRDVATRVSGVMRTITSRHPGETVMLVGHDVVNRVFLLLALELPLSRFWRIGQDPCAVNRLTFSEAEGWTVHSLNETAHLAPLREPRL
jgi:probable phosphoglycerate mutase